MVDHTTATIGRLVEAGYMASFHEGLLYLHDSQGKRWVEIDLDRSTVTEVRGGVTGVEYHFDHYSDLTVRLGHLSNC
jgi:hypothetical protein